MVVKSSGAVDLPLDVVVAIAIAYLMAGYVYGRSTRGI